MIRNALTTAVFPLLVEAAEATATLCVFVVGKAEAGITVTTAVATGVGVGQGTVVEAWPLVLCTAGPPALSVPVTLLSTTKGKKDSCPATIV